MGTSTQGLSGLTAIEASAVTLSVGRSTRLPRREVLHKVICVRPRVLD